jgi:hypothetical protein
MKLNTIIGIVACLTIFGKLYSQVATVDVFKCITTTQQIDLDYITDQIIYTKLENANQSILIGKINRLTANEKYVVIYDDLSRKIFLFDQSGNFIRCLLGQGKGPMEFTTVNSIDINNNHDILILFNSEQIAIVNAETDKKSIFSFEGTSPVARWLADKIVIFRPPPYYITNRGFEISIYDTHGKLIRNALRRSIEDISYNDMTAYYSCGKNADELYYWNSYTDTIYTIFSDLTISHRLILKHNNQRYPIKLSISMQSYDVSDGRYLQDSYRELGALSFLSFVYQQKRVSVLINRKTGEGHNVLYDYNKDHYQGFKNNLDGGIEFWPSAITSNGDLLTYADPNNLRESFLRNKKNKIPVKYPNQQDSLQKYVIDKINLMDNPIIIRSRHKK